MRTGEAPVIVPTLDELAADPARASVLPVHVAEALLTKGLVVLGALWGRCLTARAATDVSVEPDRLLDVRAAAERLSVSRDWLYHHARELPFTVREGERLLRFSSQGIDRYIRMHQNRLAA
ncbi:MAG: helix-turn-helix transcriptional regulator [Candidatus Binatia bacterium]